MRPPRFGRVSGLLLFSLLANLGLAGYLAYPFLAPPARPAAATDRPPPGPPDTAEIGALGKVQPAAGLLSVFGPPGDRLADLKVGVGDTVKAGQPLGTLAGDAERAAAVDAVASQVVEADKMRQALGLSRAARLDDADYEFNAADAKLEAEKAGLEAKAAILAVQERRATIEQTRAQKAKADGLPVSEQELLVAETAVAQATEEKKAVAVQIGLLTNTRTKARDSLESKKKLIAAETERALAQVPFDSLLAQKRAAEQKADDARLVARRGGRVVKLFSRPGDTLSNAPILQIADTANLLVLAEVYESDVARLRGWLTAGPVKAEIDGRVVGDGKPLTGSVTAAGVAPMVAKNQVLALGPREDADRRVVEVEVKLDPPAAAKLADYLGLQVRVTLRGPGRP